MSSALQAWDASSTIGHADLTDASPRAAAAAHADFTDRAAAGLPDELVLHGSEAVKAPSSPSSTTHPPSLNPNPPKGHNPNPRRGSAPHTPSRAAVTRQGAALAASPQGLTAVPAQNPSPSAGVGAANPADTPASSFAVAVSNVSVSKSSSSVFSPLPVAVSAHEPSRSARTTSAGASHARTQGGRNSSAIRPTEDAAGRSPAAVGRVLRRGEWAHTFPISITYNPNHFKGHKGLLENSKNLCKSVNKADVRFTAQNGKTSNSKPVLTNSCKKHGKGNRTAHNHNFNKRSPR